MSNFKHLVKTEPAAIGQLVASVLPVLVLAKIVNLDEQAIAAIIVAVNAVVLFFVRMSVAPQPAVAPAASPAPETRAAAT